MYVRRVFAVLAAACVIAVVAGEIVMAQNPPARGMRWSKAAPFPEPEEELYGTVVNGKFYVIGGFGFTPPGVQPPPPGVSKGPCFSCPPALVYEYDPGPDKWTKKKNIPVPVHHQAQAAFNGKILPSMPTAVHGNAMGFLGNKLHVVSGKMEGGGAPDMAGTEHPYATASHDVLEMPSGTQ